MRRNLFWLSDEQWSRVEPYLPTDVRGVERVDDRRVISGIVHVLKSGCRWCDCPPEYGPPTTIYNRFVRWARRGLWENLFRELAGFGRSADTEMIDVAARARVFARVAPEQKLRLVEALQARGQVVAMTGDGVNDAPALMQADIGIAMGITGTEVAKEAADMVLTDDNFATIEAAVEEGRRIFDNLTKFFVWTLPTNGGEALVIIVSVLAGTGVALPVLPVQILWINMTTALLLGLMLAFETKEADVMFRPPRVPDSPILTAVLIQRIILVSLLMLGAVFALFLHKKAGGADLAEARTVAVNVIVMIELFYLFNCRSLRHSMRSLGFFSNPWVIGGSVATIALQLFFTYNPWMNTLFHSAPLAPADWANIVAVSAAVSLVVGAEKWIRQRSAPVVPSPAGKGGIP